jgi:hypothetical protein
MVSNFQTRLCRGIRCLTTRNGQGTVPTDLVRRGFARYVKSPQAQDESVVYALKLIAEYFDGLAGRPTGVESISIAKIE